MFVVYLSWIVLVFIQARLDHDLILSCSLRPRRAVSIESTLFGQIGPAMKVFALTQPAYITPVEWNL